MSGENKPKDETLEDILAQIEGEKKGKRPKVDWAKYIPVGWRRLTDEQRKSLQDLIYRYLEINRAKAR